MGMTEACEFDIACTSLQDLLPPTPNRSPALSELDRVISVAASFMARNDQSSCIAFADSEPSQITLGKIVFIHAVVSDMRSSP